MLTKTRLLVLRCTPYGENGIVARFLTRELGAYSYMLYGIRSKKSRITPAMLHPMALLEAEVLHKADSDLQRIPELQPLPYGSGGYGTPGQLLAAGLLAEVLSQAVHDHDPQPDLFDWLADQMEALMLAERPAELVVAVLTELPGWLGFSVDASTYQQGSRLNFTDGVFVGPEVPPSNTRNLVWNRWDHSVGDIPQSAPSLSQWNAASNENYERDNQPAFSSDSSEEGKSSETVASSSTGRWSPARQASTSSKTTGAHNPSSIVRTERGHSGVKGEYADPKSSFEMAFYLTKSHWPDNFQCSEAYLHTLYGLYTRHLPNFRIPRSHSMFCCLLMK